MLRLLAAAALVTALAASAAAQTPGVTEVAPGVREIDGAKVPSVSAETAALEAMINDKKSLRAVRKMLGGDGITSPGPQGTTVHMYKMHDKTTGKDQVVVLFVKGDAIVDHLIS